MSHPAKNYSRPPPRQGHPYPFIKLLFRKGGLKDSPFLSEIPVEVLEGAEAMRFGLKDGGGVCVNVQQGKGLVLHSLIHHGQLANLEKSAISKMLKIQSCISAAKLVQCAVHVLQEQSREHVPSRPVPQMSRRATSQDKARNWKLHPLSHPASCLWMAAIKPNILRAELCPGCTWLTTCNIILKTYGENGKKIIGSIDTLYLMDSAIQQPLLYTGSSQWSHLLPMQRCSCWREGGSSSNLLGPCAQVLQGLRVPLQTQPCWVRKTPSSCLQLSFEHRSSYELGMPWWRPKHPQILSVKPVMFLTFLGGDSHVPGNSQHPTQAQQFGFWRTLSSPKTGLSAVSNATVACIYRLS